MTGRILLLLVTMAASACSSWEPWLKPYDRENLSDPVMNTVRNPVSGAGSVTGGGCGCN